jgi:hypothetical protein
METSSHDLANSANGGKGNPWQRREQEHEKSVLKKNAPPIPTPAEMFEMLKDAKTKLPPPFQLAKIAAAIGPADNPDEAIRKAAWLYLRAMKFCASFKMATAEQRACMCGQFDVYCESPKGRKEEWVDLGPVRRGEVTDYNSFLKRVVGARTPADSSARLRLFFLQQCPQTEGSEAFAVKKFEFYKGRGTTESDWEDLADRYTSWWNEQKSNKARESAKKKKPGRKAIRKKAVT